MGALGSALKIAGYCRISVDDELDRENTSIENQKAIIEDYVGRAFPGARLDFYEDRDRSGYTFEQRESYQRMRAELACGKYNVLVIKDFSRFSRRNGRGLVELEDLRDMGVRIISVGDGIDFPTNDDWLAIQLHFFINEMPVTDTSKKVRNVIHRRQQDGRWICGIPYGYVMINTKKMTFEPDPAAAQVVRLIFELYNRGCGYKKIANHLTQIGIPTPRMDERRRIEARGGECRIKARREWSIITIQGILENDFYIGTLRQGKYARKKINGADEKKKDSEHIVFENHHEGIVEPWVFAAAQEQRKKRGANGYRGVRINENSYTGVIFCGDCGSPMFAMSRRDLRPAYTCGSYHRRGLKGCTSHHIRVEALDGWLKSYLALVRERAASLIEAMPAPGAKREAAPAEGELSARLMQMLDGARDELKATKRQKIREIMRRPEQESLIEQTYAELEAELESRIFGLQNQLELAAAGRESAEKAEYNARTAVEIFDSIISGAVLSRRDVALIVERITVYEDRLEIKLKSDISALLPPGTQAAGRQDPGANSRAGGASRFFDVNIISEGEPLEIYTDAGGSVIFRKYSPTGELSGLAGHYCEAAHKICGRPIIICDRDSVIAASGSFKRDLDSKPITAELEAVMQTRQLQRPQSPIPVSPNVPGAEAVLIVPIIVGGDLSGCVAFLDHETPIGDMEVKLAQTAAVFFAKQMED